ncbi:MAG: SUMF1/EgtB/PvdO family nonheme iron enzyme, partial [Gemmatimonadota bacterium]
PVLRRLGGAYARGVRGVGAGSVRHAETRDAAGDPMPNSALVSSEDPAGSSATNAFGGSTGDAEDTEKPDGGSLGATGEGTGKEWTRRSHEVEAATTLVGRHRELEWLLALTTGRGLRDRIGWVSGEEGIGKSAVLAALIREWNERSAPRVAFYWSFAKDGSADHCMRAMAAFCSRGRDYTEADVSEMRVELMGALVNTQPNLLVLDGVERIDHGGRDMLLDTISLVTGSASVATSVVLGSREGPAPILSVSELHLEPLGPDAIHALIDVSVSGDSFARAPSGGFPASARDRTLASGDLLAALSGGNPEVLLSLLGHLAMGITPEEIREQFADKDGKVSTWSVARYRLSNPPFYDVREVRGLLESAESSTASGRLSEAMADASRASEIAQQIGAERRMGGELMARALQLTGMINRQMGNREEGTAQLRQALRRASESGAAALVTSIRELLHDRSQSFDDPVVEAVFHVYGRVSGVGFREWVQRQEAELQVEGTVENLRDGRIRVRCSGAQSRVEQLEQRLRVGPRMARVMRVTRDGANVASAGADVFLSYASVDREVAVRLGELLEGEGLSVFVDQASLQRGEAWREALDAALDRARCVVMLLSRASVASDWVLRESRRALKRQVLVPVMLERGVPLPVEVKELHVGDLRGWDRSDGAQQFQELLSVIVRVVGRESEREEGAAIEGEVAQGFPTADTEVGRAGTGARAEGTAGSTAEDAEFAQVGQSDGEVDEEIRQARAEGAGGSAPDGGAEEPVQSQGAESASAATTAIDLATLDLGDVEGEGWIRLEAGSFRMGDKDPALRAQPEHVVSLSAFRISRFPVTNWQYHLFVRATAGTAPRHWSDGRIPDGIADHPVTQVRWHDAARYCEWLTRVIASRGGGVVQLPTEAQWEYSARGSDGRSFPWGSDHPSAERAIFGKRDGETTPVDAHPAGATPTGIHDLAGNVWEWCRDWSGAYPSESVTEPTGAAEAEEKTRVTRGGSFRSEPVKLRAAYRANREPDQASARCGFRVVWGATGSGKPTSS